jgi:hypothetical protein
MALFKSGIITQGSGSIGGTTLSHNAGGMYMRARTIPVNPNTPAQSVVRTQLANLVNRWANTLSAAQRDAWDTYALNTPLPGPLGDPRNVGGIGMFIRGNVPRVVAGATIIDDGPTIFDTGGFTPVTSPTATDTGDLLGAAYTNTDDWANEDDAHLLVFGSRPQNPGINYFTGPYRYAGKVDGDAITPPTSPFSIANPFVFGVGQRIFFRVVVSRADGRLSTTQRLTALGA